MKGLSAARKRICLSQADLAAAMGTDRTTVTKWESGAASPPAAKLPKLAQLLGCTIDALFAEPIEEVR